jgi:hypothetical protein
MTIDQRPGGSAGVSSDAVASGGAVRQRTATAEPARRAAVRFCGWNCSAHKHSWRQRRLARRGCCGNPHRGGGHTTGPPATATCDSQHMPTARWRRAHRLPRLRNATGVFAAASGVMSHTCTTRAQRQHRLPPPPLAYHFGHASLQRLQLHRAHRLHALRPFHALRGPAARRRRLWVKHQRSRRVPEHRPVVGLGARVAHRPEAIGSNKRAACG